MIAEKEVEAALRVLQVFLEKHGYQLTEQDSTTVRQELLAGQSSTKVSASTSAEINFVVLRVKNDQLHFVVYNRHWGFDNPLSTELNHELQLARSFYGKYLAFLDILETRIILFLIGSFITYQAVDKLYLPTLARKTLEYHDSIILSILLVFIIIWWWKINLELIKQALIQLKMEQKGRTVLFLLSWSLMIGILLISRNRIANDSWRDIILVVFLVGLAYIVAHWIEFRNLYAPSKDSDEE